MGAVLWRGLNTHGWCTGRGSKPKSHSSSASHPQPNAASGTGSGPKPAIDRQPMLLSPLPSVAVRRSGQASGTGLWGPNASAAGSGCLRR